eukprot:3907119-Pyramimonas_sp.AAC.1
MDIRFCNSNMWAKSTGLLLVDSSEVELSRSSHYCRMYAVRTVLDPTPEEHPASPRCPALQAPRLSPSPFPCAFTFCGRNSTSA